MSEERKFLIILTLIGSITILGCCGLSVTCDMHRATEGKKAFFVPTPEKNQ